MVPALLCLVPEHLPRAAGLQDRNHTVGLITYISMEIWEKPPLPTTWIGAARSTVRHLHKFLYRALPSFEQQVCRCLLLLPWQPTPSQAVPVQLVENKPPAALVGAGGEGMACP